MRLLELFSGTGSIGRAFRSRGWEVHSLDILPGATVQSDILNWDYRGLPSGHYDFIWASPPCTEYSIARTRAKRPRDYELADAIVAKTLEIIEYFAPTLWLLENPQTGYLKTRAIMTDIPWRDVTYCKYGFPYKKQTRLWGLLQVRVHLQEADAPLGPLPIPASADMQPRGALWTHRRRQAPQHGAAIRPGAETNAPTALQHPAGALRAHRRYSHRLGRVNGPLQYRGGAPGLRFGLEGRSLQARVRARLPRAPLGPRHQGLYRLDIGGSLSKGTTTT